MRKNFPFLGWFLLLTFSCASPPRVSENPAGGGDPPPSAGNKTFTVMVINKTLLDIEMLDETRVVPRNNQKEVSLPVYLDELNDGYPVRYRLPLGGNFFIRADRNENIIIQGGQKSVLIESADFEAGESFLILYNRGDQVISLKRDNEYVRPLARGEPRQYSPTPYLRPGDSCVYELPPGKKELTLETDQYRVIPFPLTDPERGFLYTWVCTGAGVFPRDARPLAAIGVPVPAGFEFNGLTEKEIQNLKSNMSKALERYSPSLRQAEAGEPHVYHTLALGLTMKTLPPRPPANMELMQGEVSLAFTQNGRVLRQSKTTLTETNRANLIRALAEYIERNGEFFSTMGEDLFR
jgi:hypothetical protein